MRLLREQQLTQVVQQLQAAVRDVLVGINFMHVRLIHVQVAIAQQV